MLVMPQLCARVCPRSMGFRVMILTVVANSGGRDKIWFCRGKGGASNMSERMLYMDFLDHYTDFERMGSKIYFELETRQASIQRMGQSFRLAPVYSLV